MNADAFSSAQPRPGPWLAAAVFALMLLWALALVLFLHLPSTIPIHFNALGQPDQFVPRTPASWFLLPAVATALSAFVASTGFLTVYIARTRPRWVNMPNKQRFLAASPSERVRVVWPIARMAYGMPVVFLFLFGGILWAMERVANHALAGLPAFIPVLGVLATFVWVLAAALVTLRAAYKL